MATQAGPRSPSSPRLPSPPPIAEDQTSPMTSPEQQKGDALASSMDQSASRRIRPGTKSADMHEGPDLIELADIDSAFQLTEHLKALYHNHTNPLHLDTTQPISRSTAYLLASAPQGVDDSIWLYELCRFLVQKINIIIVGLFSDIPPCSAATCSEMRASEWQYLCAVHDPPKSCCAIDYCCHTLDWAANILTSPKHFPSRLTLGGGEGATGHGITRQHQERHLTNIFRRVYRIFAHAWFAHREVFWKVEGRTGLYTLFKTVCDVFNLVEKENYTIPPEAEGLDPEQNTQQSEPGDGAEAQPPHAILRRDSADGNNSNGTSAGDSSAATTRRHRQALSKSSTIVSTVLEENEEEDPNPSTIAQQQPPQRPSSDPTMQMTPVGPRTSSPGNVDASAIMMKGDFELAGEPGEAVQEVPQIVEPSEDVDVKLSPEVGTSSNFEMEKEPQQSEATSEGDMGRQETGNAEKDDDVRTTAVEAAEDMPEKTAEG